MAILSIFLLACTGETSSETDDSKGGGGGGGDAVIEIAITSPEKGATFDYATDITFTVETTADGNAIDPDKVTWSSGSWTDTGASVTTADLQPGQNTVEVAVKVDGETYTDSIKVTVNDPPPLDYRGTTDIQLHLELVDFGNYDVRCPGNITYTLTGTEFTGSGSCVDDTLGQTNTYEVTGTLIGGVVEGNLSMTIDGTEYPTPFTGTGAYNKAMDAAYDETYHVDGNLLRVYGTWTANPVGR